MRRDRYKPWRASLLTADAGWNQVLWREPPRSKNVKRRATTAASEVTGGPVHLAAVETILMGQFPSLVAHLVTTRWDDGTARTPGTLLVKTMGSSHVLVLKEPDDALQMQVMAQTLDDVFELAELLLSGEKAPWEPDPWAKARNTKSKK